MIHRKLLPALAVVLLCAGAVPAFSAEGVLTVGAAVERALGVHPSVAAAAARQLEAERAVAEAEAAKGPIASARLAGTRYGEPNLVSPIHAFNPAEFPPFDRTLVQGALDLRYTLIDSGARRERTRQAGAQREAADAALAGTEQEVVAAVARAFADVLARAEVQAAERTRVAAVRQELARVEKLIEVGRVAELDRLRAEAALASAEAEEVTASAELDAAERELARLLDLDPDSTRAAVLAPLPEKLAAPGDSADLAARAVAANPAVERARREVAAAEAARALARTAYFPQLRAVGSVQEFGDGGLDFTNEWNAGLQLTVPLWDGGATKSRVARAEAGRDAAQAAVAEIELAVRAGVDRALAALAESEARTEALGRAAARLAEVARVEKLRLDVGAGTQVDYLDAEAALATTRADLTAARTRALLAHVELARVTGELDIDWIHLTLEGQP